MWLWLWLWLWPRLCAAAVRRGEGIRRLLRGAGELTDVTYLWRVHFGRPWMRGSAPLLVPLFRRNHDGVMRAGEDGPDASAAPRRDRSRG